MSFGENQNPIATTWGNVADQPSPTAAAFIKKTYVHLLVAVLAFCALEYVYLNSTIAESLANMMMSNGRGGWLMVLVLFMGVAWLANYWAMSSTSIGMQYAGLGLYVVAESIILRRCCLLPRCPNSAAAASFPRRG